MTAVGFGAGGQRWVSLLHAGTTARVAFNGWHTARFPVQSGVFQGGPLSALLFVLTFSRWRLTHVSWQLSRGCVPSACPPVSQRPSCTAMQTTPPSSPADAAAILAGSISRHCQATGARMQTAKSTGMGIGFLQHLAGPDAAISIIISAAGLATTHLGIAFSTDADAAAHSLYADILQRLDRRIARWSGFWLSLLGKTHVAKQVLVSTLTYCGTFITLPADILRQLCTTFYTFVASQHS